MIACSYQNRTCINNSTSAFIRNPAGTFEMTEETLSLVSHSMNLKSSIHLGCTGSLCRSLTLISLYVGIVVPGSCADMGTTFFTTGLYFVPLDSQTVNTNS